MANVKISELPDASELTGDELVPVVQEGTTVQTTVQDIANRGANVIQMACSDLTTPLTANEFAAYVRAAVDFTLDDGEDHPYGARISLLSASDGEGPLQVDILVNDESIFGPEEYLEIPSGELSSVGFSAPPLFIAEIAVEDVILVQIAGGGENALGLIATLVGR